MQATLYFLIIPHKNSRFPEGDEEDLASEIMRFGNLWIEQDTRDLSSVGHVAVVKLAFLIDLKRLKTSIPEVRKFLDDLVITQETFDKYWTVREFEDVETASSVRAAAKKYGVKVPKTGVWEIDNWLKEGGILALQR